MTRSRFAGGATPSLWIGALGALALLAFRPARDLEQALALLDGAMAAAFFAGGLVIGRRTTRIWAPLLASTALVFGLRMLALVALRLGGPSLTLPLFAVAPSLAWMLGALGLGALGGELGAREGASTVFLYEARVLLRAPSTWLACAGFSLLAGTSFVANLDNALSGPGAGEGLGARVMIPTIQEAGSLLLFVAPLLALRFAARPGHAALPLSSLSLVAGRFGAGLVPALLCSAAASTLPLFLVGEARVPLLGAAVAALGLGLLSCAACALGVLFASLRQSAAGAGGLGLFFSLGVGLASQHAQAARSPILRGALSLLALPDALDPFARGVLDSRAVLHLLLITGLGLFFAVRVQEGRRWWS